MSKRLAVPVIVIILLIGAVALMNRGPESPPMINMTLISQLRRQFPMRPPRRNTLKNLLTSQLDLKRV